MLQDKATSGKQGLGIKDRPKKIAGVHYQGKKTSFDDSDEEEESAEEPSTEPSVSAKRKRDDSSEIQETDEPKLKLKKLCKKLLKQVGNCTLKAL